MNAVLAFIKLGRPHFLAGGFILYGLGAAIAAAHGHHIDIGLYVLGQAVVTALQWMTHYANEYFDLEADRANATPTRWSGGSRVLVAQVIRREVALYAALVLAAVGFACGIALAFRGGALVVPTVVVMFVLAWGYSAPPLRLCAAGLGELDVALVVTVLVPWLGFYVQAPNVVGIGVLAIAVVPLALLQFAMTVAIEFPDAEGDAATGKRTLVVRFGARAAAKLYIGATAVAFAWPLAMLAAGLPARVAIATAALAPIAVWRIVRVRDHADATAYERLTFWAVALLVGTSAIQLAAWVM